MDRAIDQRRARAGDPGGVFQEVGTVTAADGALVRVRTEAGEFDATRAPSCLVMPELDDAVLLAVPPQGALYVLAVLERTHGAPLRLVADADLVIELPRGRFRVVARDLELVAAEELAVVSRRAVHRAAEADVLFDRLGYAGAWLRATVQRVTTTVDSAESFAERITQHVKRSYRAISEIDVTRAREVDMRAEESFNIRAGTALVTAKDVVRIDGEQIHLG